VNFTLSCRRNAPSFQNSISRAGDLADGVLCGELRHRLLQREAAFQRARLLRGPSPDPAAARSRLEIGVGLRIRHDFHRPAHPHLAAQALPVEHCGGLHRPLHLAALGALEIGVEGEAAFIEPFQQNHAHIGQAVGVNRRERHGVRIVHFRSLGLLQPFAKQRERVVAIGKVTAH
jgi:hypothetical protein